RARVRLAEAAPLTGGLLFELLEVEGFGKPSRAAGRSGAPKRRQVKSKIKRAKAAKKARRAR
ncbi:MAG: hypothetical protein AAF360_18070, partial [Pseudomonadota bacterium]